MSESGKETGEAIWTEADQARADLIAEIACEISENEDVVAMALDAYDARRGAAEAAAPALYAALEKIGGPESCGCQCGSVCKCNSQEHLAIWKEEVRELARSALLLSNTGGK